MRYVIGHLIPRRTLLIAVTEAIIIAACVYLAMAALTSDTDPVSTPRLIAESAILAAILVTGMALLGIYVQSAVYGPQASAIRLVMGVILGYACLAVIASGIPQTDILGLPGAAGTGLAVALLVSERRLLARWPGADPAQPRLLVLGTGSRAARIEELRQAQANMQRFQLVCYLPASEGAADHEVPADRILSRAPGTDLRMIVAEHGIDEIVTAVRDRRQGALPVAELMACRLDGVRVIDLTDFIERETGQIMVDSVNTSWFVFTDGFRTDRLRHIVKRAFDLAASTALLVPALPVMLVASAAILLTMGRPVFYTQQRTGAMGEPFSIRKFRSMYNDAEAPGSQPRWASATDDRITPLGRWLRKLRIDELPQILNVFMGDMSFVGPRPERPVFVAELAEAIPFYEARHSIKPGITGWAQVCYPYAASVEDTREKLQYDLYYVKNHSLFLDLTILFETIKVVLLGKGAR